MFVPRQPDVLIVGGGLGGVAAALAVGRAGLTAVLTEETDWLGGQLTSQGVPPDEHPWIEQFGCTRSYRQLRSAIREVYRRGYPLRDQARSHPALNPGAGLVSKLCAEPSVMARVLEDTLAPYTASGKLVILRQTTLLDVHCEGDRIAAVTVSGPLTREPLTIRPRWVIDASELGDVLDLGGVEHVTGFESQKDTGEPSAPSAAQPRNMQAVSWCFAIDHRAGEDHTIDKPSDWGYWSNYRPDYWPGPMLGLVAPHPHTHAPLVHSFEPNHQEEDPLGLEADQSKDPGSRDLWRFRRLLARGLFRPGAFDSDIVLVNWPMIDYVDGPVYGDTPDVNERHREGAKRLARAALYWLQTEAPRPDGGTGWPGLRLRPDVMGTVDGFAKSPYIRESRRIKALTTIREQDLSLDVRGDAGAVAYHDSVGVGMYRIDLHPSTGGDNYIDVGASPFEIPLGALIPERVTNLIAGGKTIGTTHITNGCYRLHPVEWNVGEVAGLLAAHCTQLDMVPAQLQSSTGELQAFQARCDSEGVERRWPSVKGY